MGVLFLVFIAFGFICSMALSLSLKSKIDNLTLSMCENILFVFLTIFSMVGLIVLPYLFVNSRFVFLLFGIENSDIAIIIKQILQLIVTIHFIWLLILEIRMVFNKCKTPSFKYFSTISIVIHKCYSSSGKILLICFIFIIGMLTQNGTIPIQNYITPLGAGIILYFTLKLVFDKYGAYFLGIMNPLGQNVPAKK